MAAPKKNKTKLQPPATVQNFPIVGIGASAGGLDAFKSLIKAIPEDSGMAYVLVQHLDPSHESILPEILQRATKIPVLEITDDIHLAPDHIYVIPANKMLLSTDGVLKLADRAKKINLSIDIFFTSLAEVHKEFAVGVVLSGTGSDGTLGLKAIKEHGGISIAQDSESAAYDSMPQSAIHAGVVDFILAPEKIPEQLLHINSTYKITHIFKEEEELPKDDEAIFKQILSLIRQRSGVDFTYYKKPTFHRRIVRRIAITQKKNLAAYLKLLRTDKAEQDALFQDILIPVTSFFRDPKTFQYLSSTVFPALLNSKSQDKLIRIWVAGCSTGEEAYSIAICLHEYLTLTKRDGVKVQIFASDISEKAIKKARQGIFAKAEVEKLSEERIKNYFQRNNGGYEVNKHIRDLCVFAPHNFLKDPPFAKMDLISCRNVLIYMDTFLQKKALTTFHYALKENGFLLLGKSESTNNVSELFAAANQTEKIYSRKQLPGRFMPVTTERKEEALVIKSQKVIKQEATQTDFRKSAEQMLLSKFTPASVVVNEQMDIVHIHGSITPFLEQPQGKPTHNLLKMAHEGLSFELRNALHKAKLREVAVTKENIPVKINGKQFLVSIEIVPLTDTVDIHYLILFTKTALPPSEEKTKTTSSRKIVDAQKQNEQLEKELAHTREDMRSVTEDMEATNEELQSANEELQSSNEEMQSLNEEMETSKEELQSTNEELTIVNQELLDKQEQLNTSRFYSEAIVTTMREPLVVLDKALRVKTANASFYKKFNVDEEETENKLFYEIQNHQFDDTLLRSLLEKILPQKNRIEDFEINLHLHDKGERLILINARQIVNEKKAEQLILLAMEDITDRVNSEKQIQENAEEQRILASQLKLATDSANVGTWSLNVVSSELEWSNIHNIMWGYDEHRENLTYEDWHKVIVPEDKELAFKKVEESKVNHNIYEVDYRIKRANDGAIVWIKSTGQYYYDEFGVAYMLTGISIDITESKEAEQNLLKVLDELNNKNKIIEASEKRFSNILSQSLLAIAILKGSEMVVSFANEPIIDIWGKGKDIIGKPLLEVLPEIKDQPIPKLLDDVYTTGVPFISPEIKAILNRYGKMEDVYFNLVFQPYRDVDDTITGITILATEITNYVLAKKQIEENAVLAITTRQIAEEAKTRAEKATVIAEHAVMAKQQFLSNMSHEIRTPMNAIIGFTKVLMKTDLSEKQKEYLQAINTSGNTLIVLINDILDLAKVDSGKMMFIDLPFKLGHSINTILHLFETQIQEKNLELVKEYDSGIPEVVLGDSVRLHQILINLLSNAIKFTAKGKITVSVKLLSEDKEKVTLEIKVTDTGIGIPQNKIEAIFENFEQAHIITSSVYGGTGLGLAIVKQLVEKQGGTISVKSKVDEGSTFSFILNFQKTGEGECECEGEGEGECTQNINIKVLVVEDIKLNQLLMRTILDDFKFAWDIADNGKIAIEKLSQKDSLGATNAYDIILMDLQMPVMNGFEATEYIRNKMNLQIPIIALTADVTTVDVEKCKAIGMNDYIAKPLDEKLLYRKILDLVKSK